MKLIKALRSAYRFAKLGAGVGTVLGAIVATLDDDNKDPANAASVGMATGSVVGAVVGVGASLIDDHYAKVYCQA